MINKEKRWGVSIQGTEDSEKGPGALTVAALSGLRNRFHFCVSILFALQKRQERKLQSIFNVCMNHAAEKADSSLLEQVVTVSAAPF